MTGQSGAAAATASGLSAYRQAVRYLESFVRGPSKPPADRIAAGRERMAVMQSLTALLGNPERAFRSVHVGGTSGKGSTSVLIAAALQAAGLRTGLHTSPYLQEPVERLLVNGRPIAPQRLTLLVDELRAVLEGAPDVRQAAGFIQLWSALTFQHFAQEHVDLAVIEVSLGGRYDSTNVLEPEVAVITNVGHDHLAALGPSLADVARHKAGILKHGVPTVTAATAPEALAVIEREAAEVAAPLWLLGREVRLTNVACDATGARMDVDTPAGHWHGLRIGLLGPHQAVNAATAVAAIELLRDRGLAIAEDAVRAGFAAAAAPGRFEVVQHDPLVILDGAHNLEKAASLSAALKALYPGVPVTLVLGVGASKELPEMLAALLPAVTSVVCTEAPVLAKPVVPAAALAAAVRAAGLPATVERDPQAAVQVALALAGPQGLVCVTGSMYLVGAVRGRWHTAATLLAGERGG